MVLKLATVIPASLYSETPAVGTIFAAGRLNAATQLFLDGDRAGLARGKTFVDCQCLGSWLLDDDINCRQR